MLSRPGIRPQGKGKTMSLQKSVMFSALPLLWVATAFAQGAPVNPPPADQATPPQAEMMHRKEDPAARHKAFCSDRYAHEVAHLAYLEAKLDLSEKQRATWHKWQQWQLDGADKEQAACLSDVPKPDEKPTALEMESRLERALTIKLQNLQSSRPSLEALYETLTPAQRSIFDRPPHGDHFAPPHGAPFGHPGFFPPEQ
jgi:hypothetical protein